MWIDILRKHLTAPRTVRNPTMAKDRTIAVVEETLREYENNSDVKHFMIDMLGRELAAHYNYVQLESVDGPDDSVLIIPGYFQNAENKVITIDDSVNVACIPWNIRRVADAIHHVREMGYSNDRYDACKGIWYPELNFCVIENAHHHTVAAQYLRGQSIQVEAQIVKLKKLYPLLNVSNDLYWENAQGIIKGYVPDPRLALMYKIAQTML